VQQRPSILIERAHFLGNCCALRGSLAAASAGVFRRSQEARFLKVAELIAMLEDHPLDAEVVIDDASTKRLLMLQTVEEGNGYVALGGSYNEVFED
jgi:hypothetical protein